MAANHRFETLMEMVGKGGGNLKVACECGHRSVVDGRKLSRLYFVMRWNSRKHMIRDHLRCSKCGARPARVEPTYASVNPAPHESLDRRALLRDRLVVVASPALACPEDGMAMPAVVRTTGDRQTWRVRPADGRVAIPADPVLGLASLVPVRDAVHAGVGAARLPISLVSHDVADGRLVQWGEVDAPEIALWTLYPSRRLLSARVAAFLAYLKEAFPNGRPDELAAYVER